MANGSVRGVTTAGTSGVFQRESGAAGQARAPYRQLPSGRVLPSCGGRTVAEEYISRKAFIRTEVDKITYFVMRKSLYYWSEPDATWTLTADVLGGLDEEKCIA